MSQAIAIETVRADLRRVADLGGDATTGRYPNVDCNRQLNRAYRRLRELASGNGHQIYLKQSTPAVFTIGALANTSFGTIPMPADCLSVYGIDVVFAVNDVRSLVAADWDQRGQFMDGYGQPNWPPQAFHVYNAGTEAAGAVTAGSIAIFPAPSAALTYTTWYLPNWTDITDGAVFDVKAGWDAFLFWDAAIPFLAGDNDRQQAYGIATTERNLARELITKRATTVQRVGTGARRDVRAEQRIASVRGRWPWI